MEMIDRDGHFRGQVEEYGLEETQGGSVGVVMKVRLDQMYYEDQWNEWPAGSKGCYCTAYIIKKDGEINKQAAEQLINHAGWDGRIESIVDKSWQPTPCQFEVKPNEYKGKVTYRGEWISGYDDKPGGGGVGSVDQAKASAIINKYGSKLRAVASSLKRNSTPPTSPKPPAPPPGPKREPLPKHDDLPEDTGPGVDENGNPIPF